MVAANVQTTCRVCGSHETAGWLYPREMMYGLREQFAYFRCAVCDCLQIDQVPADIGKHYPSDYYSFGEMPDPSLSRKAWLKRKFFYPAMTRHKLGWGSAFGAWCCRHGWFLPAHPDWLRFLAHPMPLNGGVLDVGCGSGAFLLALRNCGFTNLLGVDPYLKESITYSDGLRIDKCTLSEVKGKFSLIMFHHVFEHLENPLETLRQARQLLSPGGQILIRIPLSDSAAARQYQENWVQLDSPRHITLQTRKSMEVLAQKSNLKIARVVYDSIGFQFWASEQYLKDIPLRDKNSYGMNSASSMFAPETIKKYEQESERLNTEEKGDQAAFVLVA